MFKNYYIIGAIVGVLIGAAIIYVILQTGIIATQTAPPVPTGAPTPANAPVSVGSQPAAKEAPSAQTTAIGTSQVTTAGIVTNVLGKTADNAATPRAPEAPQQSQILKKTDVPKEALQITGKIDGSGFSPNTFLVKAGQPLTLALASGDGFSYVLKFDDPSLKAVAVGVSGTDIRAITFNAPDKKGDYTFYSDVPGHRDLGLVGKMIVN